MSTVVTPSSLGQGGALLWAQIASEHVLDASQQVTLLEVCRCKDRLDKLDEMLRGNVDTWASLVVDVNSDGQVFELRITQALAQANSTANLMKQLIAALRLPDAATGKKPQYRGPRGVQAPRVDAKVSSLDRARAAKSS